MRDWLRRMMIGRNGQDDLSRFEIVLALILIVIQLITKNTILYFVVMALLIHNLMRMYSRNIEARQRENQWFLRRKDALRGLLHGERRTRTKDPDHKIYTCPGCRQKVRVPKGRGRIAITCPKCGAKFIKKT